jgi:hypothetical protein
VSDFAKDLAETDNLSGKTQDRVTLQIQIRALDLHPASPAGGGAGEQGSGGAGETRRRGDAETGTSGTSEGAGGGGRVGDLLVTGQGQAKGDWLKWKGEENFEQTFIGMAIDQALRQAVPALLAELARTGDG